MRLPGRGRAPARGLVLLAALSLGGLGACDDWSASTEHQLPTSPLASTSILHKMVGATQRVQFQAVRRFEAHWSNAAGPQSLVYRETVSSDGTGLFAVDPLDLIEPVLPPAQSGQFLLLQKVRERLLFRYRDFEIRDLDAFTANYVTEFTGQTVQVAGRTAERLEIQRSVSADDRTLPERRYVVDVDSENGLVLRAREELLDGTPVALSEFESLDLSPDLSQVVLSQPLAGEQQLPPGSAPLLQFFGFQPNVPKQVPAGWRLIEVAALVDPTDGRTWAKMVYSDGVNPLFFLAAAPSAPTYTLVGSVAPEADRVRSLSIGPWTVLQGSITGREVVVMGKEDEQILADLIRSAFP